VLIGTPHQGDTDVAATTENVLAALAGTDFFWLDLDDTEPDDMVSELLRTHFGFHPLAVRAAERFSQRPRLDEYDGFAFLVARGADADQSGHAEVHCFWTDRDVVTVHRGDCAAIDQVRERVHRHSARQVAPGQVVIVYLVVGELVDSFFPYLSALDDRIDALEDEILKAPTEEQLDEIFHMKRTLIDARRLVTPRRDAMASVKAGVADVPGMNDEAARYFRDLYDHLIRLST